MIYHADDNDIVGSITQKCIQTHIGILMVSRCKHLLIIKFASQYVRVCIYLHNIEFPYFPFQLIFGLLFAIVVVPPVITIVRR